MPVPMSSSLRAAYAMLAVCTLSAVAQARVVERIVAVIGDQPLMLTEVKERAKPVLARLYASQMSEAQRVASEGQILHEAVQRLVDERLMSIAADKAHLSVTEQEVDNALKNVAAKANVTLADLLSEAGKQGLTEEDYRVEIRRQLLEGKLANLRLRGRIRISEDDARAAYNKFVREAGAEPIVDIGLIALRVRPEMSDADKDARLKLANEISQKTADGEDFCKMAAEHSDDTETKATCGSRGPQPLSAFMPELKERISALKVGGVTEAFVLGDALVILKLRERPEIPAFDKVKDQMSERAYGEAMEKQRKAWLGELRRETYVDVRM